MNTVKIKLLIILSFLCASATAAMAGRIEDQAALSKVKRLFEGRDVDYYRVTSSVEQASWQFFVDAEPTKGWEHECYLVSVYNLTDPPALAALRMPPNVDMTPVLVSNRYGASANDKPNLASSELSNEVREVARRTYAMIISGGANKNSNYERYWNDCSFVYQMLVKTYGVPKENISVLISDGTDPSADMLTVSGTYKSSPLDLDGDGVADTEYAATKDNVKQVLTSLSNKLNADDQLFIYVIDHGGTHDYAGKSYIWLWNMETLEDYELGEWIKPFVNKSVTVNSVFGQCYSGGFLDDMAQDGCVVTAASASAEPSWACPDKPYDEFVYHWTSAVNKKDAYGNIVKADLDANDFSSMHEAFYYAQTNDRITKETPQFWANPETVGMLAFDQLIPTVDLIIKDNWNDFGLEPNRSTECFWDSPCIWLRNNGDGIEEHESIYYSPEHYSAVIYVKVQNRGKKPYKEGLWVSAHYSMSSTAISARAWNGLEVFDNKLSGDRIRAVHIDPKDLPGGVLNPGETMNVRINWAFPDDLEEILLGQDGSEQHICLLARIVDTPIKDIEIDSGTYYAVLESSRIAQKNVSIVPAHMTSRGTRVYVGNPKDGSSVYTLELRPQMEAYDAMFDEANVEIELSPLVYNAWKRGGSRLKSAIVGAHSVSNPDNVVVKLLDVDNVIQGINLRGKEFDTATLKFDFLRPSSTLDHYKYDLIQRDENGVVIGGESFLIIPPTSSNKTATVRTSPLGSGIYELAVENEDYESLVWRDAAGSKLSVDAKINVAPDINNHAYSLSAINGDGEMSISEVPLVEVCGIKAISYVPGSDEVIVELASPAAEGESVSIASASSGQTPIAAMCEPRSSVVSVDVSSLPRGVYSLSYSYGDRLLDARKFVK
ncbi:MAG: C13 family peptidase [[Clostridium] fimetarium]|nr:C13 family peptidase [Alistipes timonensis]MCM1405632.1 C13 family peptidase [[Clostridium] fimetarium]